MLAFALLSTILWLFAIPFLAGLLALFICR